MKYDLYIYELFNTIDPNNKQKNRKQNLFWELVSCALTVKWFQEQFLPQRDLHNISEQVITLLHLDIFQTALKSDNRSSRKLPLRSPFLEQFRRAFDRCRFPNVDCCVTCTPLNRMSLRARSNLESLVSRPTSGDYRIWDGIKTNEEGLKPSLTRKCATSFWVWGLCGSEVLSYSQFSSFSSKWISQQAVHTQVIAISSTRVKRRMDGWMDGRMFKEWIA